MTRLDPFFSYYGAGFRKCRAGFYPPPREGDLIVERFAGSAAYACTFGADREVLLIDLDPVICSVWGWLIRATPEDVLALPLRWPEDKAANEIGLDPGAANLIGFWLGRALASPRFYRRGWAREYAARKPGSFWGCRVRERIARQVPHIKLWSAVCASYADAEVPTTRSTVVDDPPYQAGQTDPRKMPGRHYKVSCRGLDPAAAVRWYRQLAASQDALAAAGHRVVVWEQEGADWRPDFEPCGVVKALEGRNGKKTSREARAVLNGPEGWPS